MNKVRCGVIGIKGIGQYHVDTLAKLPQAQVTALADIDADAMKARAGEIGATPFTDYRQMLASGLVDAVTIAIPHHLHVEVGLTCLRAGVHVLMEKPMASRVSEVDAMMAAATEHRVKLGVLHQYRKHRASRVLKQVIDSGVIGDITRVLWTWVSFRPEQYYARDPWRTTWSHAGGGVLMNQASHDLDLLCWLVGKPVQVSAMIANQLHQAQIEDIASASVLFENGAVATFQSTINQPAAFNVRQIAGSKGMLMMRDVQSLTVDRDDEILLGTYENDLTAMAVNLKGDHDQPGVSWRVCPLPASFKQDRTPAKRIARRFDKMLLRKLCKSPTFLQRSKWLQWSEPMGHYGIIRDFIEAIIADRPPAISGENALPAIELINAIILSAVRGKTVHLPVDRAEYDTLFAELCSGKTAIPRLHRT